MKTILGKDHAGHWNTIPPVPIDKIDNVNCHKFVLYVVGKISFEELISDAKVQKAAGEDFTYQAKAREISDMPFTLIERAPSLDSLVARDLEFGNAYVGQILDAQTNELAHSFVIVRNNDSSVVYDKPGFKYPFAVCDIQAVFDFINKEDEYPYHNQKWRFVPISI